jgi:ubiquinone/menaquinone biosynthesis C-methylase UbiE
MFWDKVSPLYDLFENVYNHKVYTSTGKKVAEFIDSTDDVLECACGTGAITICIAKKCNIPMIARRINASQGAILSIITSNLVPSIYPINGINP